MAQKEVRIQYEMLMKPNCHPDRPMQVIYRPQRGGDHIVIKCSDCYREFFDIKLAREGDD